MKRWILIWVLLPVLVMGQAKTFLPFPITSSNGRPINDADVDLYVAGTTTKQADLTYLPGSGGWYYWTGDTTTVPSGIYDVYVNGIVWRTNVRLELNTALVPDNVTLRINSSNKLFVDTTQNWFPKPDNSTIEKQYNGKFQLKDLGIDSVHFGQGARDFIRRNAATSVTINNQPDGVTIRENTSSKLEVIRTALNDLTMSIFTQDTTIDISGYGYTNPAVVIVNKGGWPIRVKSVTSTTLVIETLDYGYGSVKFDVILYEK